MASSFRAGARDGRGVHPAGRRPAIPVTGTASIARRTPSRVTGSVGPRPTREEDGEGIQTQPATAHDDGTTMPCLVGEARCGRTARRRQPPAAGGGVRDEPPHDDLDEAWPRRSKRGRGTAAAFIVPAAGRHSMRPARHEARSRDSQPTKLRAWSVGPRPTRDEDGVFRQAQPSNGFSVQRGGAWPHPPRRGAVLQSRDRRCAAHDLGGGRRWWHKGRGKEERER
jgi:hypothetical protein